MIDVNNLEYSYPGSTELTVKGISFSIENGEIFGFLGPSGAGKSTTQKILIGILSHFKGDISIMDKRRKDWGADFFNHVGVGFELPNHYQKLTARENLTFFASFYDKPVMDPLYLMGRVGLQDDADKKVEEYSKGMKMRLNFIRALMHDPDILFFDEPTTGLDPVNARLIKDIILEEKQKGKTIFVTTHNMHDADELCDRVAFIVDGSIQLIDSPKALKVQNGKRMVKVEYLNSKLEMKEFDMTGLADNNEFLNLLRSENIQSIHSEEASLDDIFIKVTGRHLQ